MSQKIQVSVLGATGVVGQRFVARLARHPRFELVHLAASERSEGRAYGEACTWRVPGTPPHAGLAQRKLVACRPDAAFAPIVFSALDSATAREVEPAFAAAGALVFSNASAFRMVDDVPLLVPEANPEHLQLLAIQRQARGWKGGIVCNPNCTAAVLVTALAPLHAAFGIEALVMTSLQATSGAGYPGVPSLDVLGNVVPHIAEEEEKVQAETVRMLGTFRAGRVAPAKFAISALCNRVAVIDGHSESVSVRLRGEPGLEAVREALASWNPLPQQLGLPTAPVPPIVLHTALDRPQPRLDVETGGGMAVHVGRLRACPVLGLKLQVLGHNLERGAAGGSVLNAELALAQGLL